MKLSANLLHERLADRPIDAMRVVQSLQAGQCRVTLTRHRGIPGRIMEKGSPLTELVKGVQGMPVEYFRFGTWLHLVRTLPQFSKLVMSNNHAVSVLMMQEIIRRKGDFFFINTEHCQDILDIGKEICDMTRLDAGSAQEAVQPQLSHPRLLILRGFIKTRIVDLLKEIKILPGNPGGPVFDLFTLDETTDPELLNVVLQLPEVCAEITRKMSLKY